MITLLMEHGGAILGILAILAGVFGIYRKGKNDATAKHTVEEAKKQTQAQAKETARVVAEVKHEAKVTEGKANVQADVIRMPNGAAADRLRDQWSRD